MKQRVFLAAMSVAVLMMVIAGVSMATGAPQEQVMVVTSAADSGPGTLREALERAIPGTTITFDPSVFPLESPAAIAVTSPLPDLAQGEVTIDGNNAGVILDGSRLPRGEMMDGLLITSNGNVIRGLQILHFPGDGVWIGGGTQYNLIGGATAGERNVISGNGKTGVVIDGSMYNTISGNYIGTDATGTRALGNATGVGLSWGAQHNLIGGATAGERNVISGNGWEGVWIGDPTTSNNSVSGNYIGTNASGTAAIPNRHFGVNLANSTHNNLIGGAAAGEGNLISGNEAGGVNIAGDGVMCNVVIGNYVGTDATGTAAIGNAVYGITFGSGARNNRVGGETAGERNLISGNGEDGIRIESTGTMSNTVIGNYIGTDVSGTVAVGNKERGVFILDGAQHNLISDNLISGNGNDGVPIEGNGTTHNTVSGNYIGTSSSGTEAIGNGGDGLYIAYGAQHNVITNNLISGNNNGIQIVGSGTAHNSIIGNYIGVDLRGTEPLGKQGDGVLINRGAGPNTIGPGNTIAFNRGDGVEVRGSDTLGNTITGNSIYENEGLGVKNYEGGNAELSPPTITYIGTRFIRGTVIPNATVEIFSDEEDEGRIFEGSTVSDEEGNFAFRMPVGRFTGPNVTATVTDTVGNTSGFSPPESPPAPVVTRELPDIVAPTQVSVEPKVVGTNLGLALFCVLFFGFTSTVFNRILEDYRDELAGAFNRLIPGPLAVALDRVGPSLRGMTEKGRGRLLLMWLMVLLVTSLIESFLDPEVGLLSPERLGILITLFISAVVVSGLELGSNLYAHRRLAPTMKAESKIQWIGMAVAVACVILSRALDFKPGYLYGIVGAIYLMPRLADIINSGKRAVLVLLSIFAGGFILWIATTFLPTTLADLEPLFLTIFLISLQGVFFGLFPLALTDGGDIWNWRRGVWFAFFSVVFFCFYHFLLNPNASDVQALQQNGVQTLLILMLVFGLATFTLWLLFPFRLGRKRVSQG